MADEGFGTTITFQSGFFAEITNVDWDGIKRGSIPTSHMTTTEGWMTFQPSDLKDAGELSVEIAFAPQTTIITAITAAAETVTVTLPIPAGQSVASTWACSGFMTDFKFKSPMDGKMMADVKLKFSGKPTITAGH